MNDLFSMPNYFYQIFLVDLISLGLLWSGVRIEIEVQCQLFFESSPSSLRSYHKASNGIVL